MRARLAFSVEKQKNAEGTVLRLLDQEPPWKVVRGFTSESGASLIHLNNVSGGVLGGDQLDLQVQVGPGASAQITSTGATRVYRSRDGSPARSCTQVSLAENSLLELLPDALIPYADSSFDQRTCIHLGAGASLFWWEVIAPGREAAGEVFQYRSLRLETRLCAEGVPLALERFHLEPMRRPLASAARLGSHRYLATFFICRVGEDADRWRAIEHELAVIASRLSQPGDALWGVTTLARNGIVVRGLTRGSRAVWPGLYEFWRAAKFELLGQEAVLPRKIY